MEARKPKIIYNGDRSILSNTIQHFLTQSGIKWVGNSRKLLVLQMVVVYQLPEVVFNAYRL